MKRKRRDRTNRPELKGSYNVSDSSSSDNHHQHQVQHSDRHSGTSQWDQFHSRASSQSPPARKGQPSHIEACNARMLKNWQSSGAYLPCNQTQQQGEQHMKKKSQRGIVTIMGEQHTKQNHTRSHQARVLWQVESAFHVEG